MMGSMSQTAATEAPGSFWISSTWASAIFPQPTMPTWSAAERSPELINRPHQLPIDLYRQRTLQQGNRENQSVAALLFYENAFHSREAAIFDADSLTGVQERPRLHQHTGVDGGLNSGDLLGSHRFRHFSEADDRNHARRDQDGQAPLRIETTENIAGEERQLQGLLPIRPPAVRPIQGKELPISLAFQGLGDNPLLPRFHTDGVPGHRLTFNQRSGKLRGRYRIAGGEHAK